MLNLRKIILTMMASATILGLEANIQPTLASARHIRTYRVRRHRTYRRRNVRRHRTYRKHQVRRHATKRYKQTYRHIRGSRRARRIRRHYRRRTAYAYRPKAGKLSTRNDYKSYQRFSKKQIAAWAKYDEYSPKEFIKFNEETAPTYGEYVKPYRLDGTIFLLSKHQLINMAHNLGRVSVKKYLKRDSSPLPSMYKIYHPDAGEPSLQSAEQHIDEDIINSLNSQRESKGINPVTQDPNLQFLAQKHAEMLTNGQCYSMHKDQNGNSYEGDLSSKYNIPHSGGANGENAQYMSSDLRSIPTSQYQDYANGLNDSWDEDHTQNQDNPEWTKAGIAVTPGGMIEDFEDNGDQIIGG